MAFGEGGDRHQPARATRFFSVESVESNLVSVREVASLREVMTKLDESARQIVLVVDWSGRLVGLITDGDLRRALLNGHHLGDNATVAMNRDFQFVRRNYEPTFVSSVMDGRGIRHLPVVDDDGRPIEVLISGGRQSKPGRPNQVVIMAGGRGVRLRPLTDDVPKPMLTVGGVPILELIVRNYASQGFRNFTLVLGYLGDAIEHHFGDGTTFGLNIRYLREEKPRGTAGSLSRVEVSYEGPMVVSNADVISSIDLGALIDVHIAGKYAMTVATRVESISVPFGVLEVTGPRILGWREKPELPTLVSAGVYVIDPMSLQYLDDGYADIPDLVDRLLAAGRPIGALQTDGLWIDVGTHDTLRSAVELGHVMMGGVRVHE